MAVSRQQKIAVLVAVTVTPIFLLFQNFTSFTPPENLVITKNGVEYLNVSLADVPDFILKLAVRRSDVPVVVDQYLSEVVEGYQRGDVNHDNRITSADALAVQRYASGNYSSLTPSQVDWIRENIVPGVSVSTPIRASYADLPNEVMAMAVQRNSNSDLNVFMNGRVNGVQRADIDNDGKITSADALIFMKIASGATAVLKPAQQDWFKYNIAPYVSSKSPLNASSAEISQNLLGLAVQSSSVPVEASTFLKTKVNGFQRGDINHDGKISSADALAMEKFATGNKNSLKPEDAKWIQDNIAPFVSVQTPIQATLSQIPTALLMLSVKKNDSSALGTFLQEKVNGFQRGDVNNDGKITSADSVLISRYVSMGARGVSASQANWIQSNLLNYLAGKR